MPAEPAAEELRDELLARWNATLSHQERMAADLLSRYAEPHRRYHTGQHLARVLRAVDELADDQDLFLVRLAAWFHDAVYAIPAGQLPNEEASARLALRELSRAGLKQEDLTQVARLARLTLPGAATPKGSCCATQTWKSWPLRRASTPRTPRRSAKSTPLSQRRRL